VGKYLNSILNIEIGKNSVFTKEQIIQVVVYTAMLGTFLETAVRKLLVVWKQKVPSADMVLIRLKQITIDQLRVEIRPVNHRIVSTAKKLRILTHAVVVAIDFHDQPFFSKAKKRDASVVTSKGQKGTKWGHRIATLDVVDKGMRFTLVSIEVTMFTRKEKIVEQLIIEARKHAKIRCVLLDRSFFSVPVINKLDELKVRYLMPAKKNSKIKSIVARSKAYRYTVTRYEMVSNTKDVAVFNLVVVDMSTRKKNLKNDDYFTYATNMKVNENNVVAIGEMYRKRWGIETGYRVKKDFRIKTCSTSPVVRYLFLHLSVILFNLWVLYKILMGKDDTYKIYGDELTSDIFRELYISVVQEMGIGRSRHKET
jgi:hypothetical protein